jgi:ABC-type bacteriocin/lantibiotic exporter with double-glycine peptidase domain
MRRLQAQAFDWDCGPTSLLNALILRGLHINPKDAVRWTKASETKGTSAANLMRTLKWLKVPFVQYSSVDARRSWRRLAKTNSPAILCVDSDEHWILLVSGVKRRIVVWDPDVGGGMMVYGRSEFMRRWVNETTHRAYGIFIA